MPNEQSSSRQVVLVGLALVSLGAVGAHLGCRSGGDKPAGPDAGSAAAPSATKTDKTDGHELHPLSRWDGPFAFNPITYLSEATLAARKKYDDAVLVSVKLARVTPAGRVNLKLKDSYTAYRFRSPSRSKVADTPGAEPCLVDVVVTGEAVQVLTPTVPALGCSSPAVSLPPCELLYLWLVTLQEQTPTEALGTWELSAPPDAKADANAAPAGQWKLTMSTASGPFERSFDSACKPIGREKPVQPVDTERWRGQNAAPAPKPPPDPNAPTLLIRPIRFKGPLPARTLQDLYEAHSEEFLGCYKDTNAQCKGCLPTATASVDLVIGADGNAAAVGATDKDKPAADSSDPQSLAQATERFERCARSVMAKVPFPTAGGATETTHRIFVMPPASSRPQAPRE